MNGMMKITWAGAMLGVCLLLEAGLVQAVAPAAPTCSPTYTINTAQSTVTLVANCAPDVGATIDFGTGYSWKKGDAVSGVALGVSTTGTPANPNTGLITQSFVEADGYVYWVKAKNHGGAYGSDATVAVSANTPPVPCGLMVLIADAPPGTTTTTTQGAPVTLVPACVGADSLDWYSRVGSSPYTRILTPPGGVVFPFAGTTKYYVVGTNDYGDTASNEVTVNTVAALAGCSISPASASKTTGATDQLFTASCSGGTPTSYAWTVDGSAVGSSSTAYTTANNLSAATHSVALTASNAGGSSSSASATLIVSALPLSSCTAISPSAPSIVVGSASPQLTATCGNTPTAYVWKLNGSAIAGCTTSTCTVPAASLPTVGGAYNVTVTADNAGGTGTAAASTAITVAAAGAGGADRCAANGVTRKMDLTVMDWGSGTYKPNLNLKATEAYALSFTATETTGGHVFTVYSSANKLITISRDVCGFDTPLNGAAACRVQQGSSRPLSPESGPAYSIVAGASVCVLTPGETYYVNIRNSVPGTNPVQSSCTNAAGCGFWLGY